MSLAVILPFSQSGENVKKKLSYLDGFNLLQASFSFLHLVVSFFFHLRQHGLKMLLAERQWYAWLAVLLPNHRLSTWNVRSAVTSFYLKG